MLNGMERQTRRQARRRAPGAGYVGLAAATLQLHVAESTVCVYQLGTPSHYKFNGLELQDTTKSNGLEIQAIASMDQHG